MAVESISLRAACAQDQPFLERLYRGSRAQEMSRSGWPLAQIQGFLSQQFQIQHAYYQEHYAGGEFFVIEHQSQPIGRLYVFVAKRTFHIVDIILLPSHQGQGIGTALLQAQLARADALNLPIELHVEHDNPVQTLYARLGFYQVADSGVYLKLRRDVGGCARKAS